MWTLSSQTNVHGNETCHHYRHFSMACDSKNIYSRNNNSEIIDWKKVRDSMRMSAFINRKTAQNLPSHNTEVQDQFKLCFNSLLRMKPHTLSMKIYKTASNQLQSTMDDQHSCVSFLRMNKVEMKYTVQKTLKQNENL